jgi:hypothetical protein
MHIKGKERKKRRGVYIYNNTIYIHTEPVQMLKFFFLFLFSLLNTCIYCNFIYMSNLSRSYGTQTERVRESTKQTRRDVIKLNSINKVTGFIIYFNSLI